VDEYAPAPANEPVVLTAESGGQRLDVFVARSLPGLSRARVQKLIQDGHVTVGGAAAKAGLKLEQGQRVRVSVRPAAPSHLRAQDIPIAIAYQDGDIIVVDKPAGMTAHPAPGHRDGTLVNAVLARVPDIAGVGGVQRPGLVHRLDKDTSGLIVLAKNDTAFAHLVAQFKTHGVKKTYIALVRGHPSPAEAAIEAPIGRSSRNRQRMAVVEDGREATTTYRVTQRYKGCSLVEATPVTGRTHQIRVHLASVGHPVVGDATYGQPEPRLGRQFLHAARLGFRLPSNNDWADFTSPLPPELSRYLDSLERR